MMKVTKTVARVERERERESITLKKYALFGVQKNALTMNI